MLTHIIHAARLLMCLTHKFESGSEDRVVVSARVVECGDDEGGGHEGVDGGGELRLAVGEQLGGEAAQHRRHALDAEAQQHGNLLVRSSQLYSRVIFGLSHPSCNSASQLFGYFLYLQIVGALIEGEGVGAPDVGLGEFHGPEELNVPYRISFVKY